MQEIDKKVNEFKEYFKEIDYLNHASSTLYWDSRVCAPKKSVNYRSEVLAYLSGKVYKLETSDKMKEFVDYFGEHVKELDNVTLAMYKNAKKNYELNMKIPEKRATAYVEHLSKSEAAWEEAKEKSDFNIFKPYLEKTIEFEKEFIGYWGSKDNGYDNLLDLNEEGATVKQLDEIFNLLKKETIDLLNKIKNSDVKTDMSIFKSGFTRDDQKNFAVFVMHKMGFDFNAGRLDESTHPFTIALSNKDVRITTHYYDNDYISNLMSCIHESGHTLYEQDIPDSLLGTGLAGGTSMGIHESQSRLYENIIGRSKAFWTYFYPELVKMVPHFKKASFDDVYRGMNRVVPSLVRTEADELTYNLHIIIRYEIEKAFINGNVKVSDIKEMWNSKYKEYLGITPSNDAEGILQDMHWSGGQIGYFPSYSLGNFYGAQFINKMKQDVPDLEKRISQGDLSPVKDWLCNHVHKYGAVYSPARLIEIATGEKLNPKYFIDYLKNKYTDIYHLDK